MIRNFVCAKTRIQFFTLPRRGKQNMFPLPLCVVKQPCQQNLPARSLPTSLQLRQQQRSNIFCGMLHVLNFIVIISLAHLPRSRLKLCVCKTLDIVCCASWQSQLSAADAITTTTTTSSTTTTTTAAVAAAATTTATSLLLRFSIMKLFFSVASTVSTSITSSGGESRCWCCWPSKLPRPRGRNHSTRLAHVWAQSSGLGASVALFKMPNKNVQSAW